MKRLDKKTLQQKRKLNISYTLLAFLLPVLAMFLFMIFRGFEPFGKTSMLYSDMYHQYYPFFVGFRDALRSGDSLLYSWDVGMGMDYLGLIAYYLASPLNLLSVIIPEGWLLEYFSLLGPIKMGLAGLFFAIFLKHTFHKNDFSIALFGTFYGLCAWALGYQWNVMWLDTFALLPLVALGTVRLLRDRKFVLFTVSLFLSVLSNYYIGLFTCIFVALIFVCYEICRFKTVGRFFADLGIIALFSILALGMTAFLELPAYAALQSTQSSVNKFPEGFKLNIADKNTWAGLFDAMRQVAGNMNGGVEPTLKEGLPNVYCGVITNILACLFMLSNRVKVRDRICAILLLIFFNVSFIVRQLDYIWHGFHFTNMIPYRFSFLYSFVMLYMAYKAWTIRDSFKLWQILAAGGLGAGLMLCGYDRAAPVFWAYNTIFLLLYVAMLCYALSGRHEQNGDVRTVSTAALAVVMVMELVLSLINFSAGFTGTTVTDYPRGTDKTASVIRYMEEREEDTLFYRAETTHSQTLNDGALNRYHGISTFTSSANVRVTEYMRGLGYGAKNTYNRYCFEESSPVSNLFLNLKYMIARDGKVEENPYFEDVRQYGKVHLLENKGYLPLGFLADSQLEGTKHNGTENTFTFQNRLFQNATGLEDEVWTMLSSPDLSITGKDVTIKSRSRTGYCSYVAGDDGGSVVYTYVVPESGFVCVDLNLPKRNKVSLWFNEVELYNETYSIPQSLAVCQAEPGDIIEVHLACAAREESSMTVRAGLLDETLFWEGYEILNDSTLELTTFENTFVEGTIDCNRDGILYTSIPQDGNWIATVDGEDAEITLIGDAMVGLKLAKGTHTVSFRYENKAFSLGCKITLGCTLIFISLYLYFYRYKPGKIENRERDDTNDGAVSNDPVNLSDPKNAKAKIRIHQAITKIFSRSGNSEQGEDTESDCR